MEYTTRGRLTVAVAILGAVAALGAGCAAPQRDRPDLGSTTSAVEPATHVQFAPDWMVLAPNQPRGWEELNRWITSDFQKFELRPVDDTEYRYGCNGCNPSTVDLTAYAPGTFDPAEARTGQSVTVNAAGDGRVTEDPARHTATLAWQYAENSWATVRGMTSATVELDLMVELARALQPVERTPIRLPLSIANLPDDLPLAQIDVDTHRDEPGTLDYGTRIEFAGCGLTDTGRVRDCTTAGDSLSVRIADRDYREPSGGVEHDVVRIDVGGRDALYDGTSHRVSVRLGPGLIAEFDVGFRDQQAVHDILAKVTWAADPGDESTWAAVSDWTK